MGGVPGLGVAYTDASFRKFVSAMKEKADVLTAAGRLWCCFFFSYAHNCELTPMMKLISPRTRD